MLTKQQKDAVERFSNWLKHPNELGKEPAVIEIAEIFEYNGEEFAVVKFKKDDDGEWLFGVCGGYSGQDCECSGYVWSESQIYDADYAKEDCIGYINKISDYWKQIAKEEMFNKLNNLMSEEKWEEVIEYVDSNVGKYKFSEEQNEIKCYQFFSYLEFVYYESINSNEKWKYVDSSELKLLNNKVYSLIKLKRFKEALNLIDYLLKISPNNASIMLEKVEIAKLNNDVQLCENLLGKIYPSVWNYVDYARFLRYKAWICSSKGNSQGVINYLALSLWYDNSDNSFDCVSLILEDEKNKTNISDLELPKYGQMREYFENNSLTIEPTEENLIFANSAYEYCLKYNEEVGASVVAEAKKNLIMINQNYPIAAKRVEVEVLTPNRYITNWKYGFAFEVPKKYNSKDSSEEKRIYEFVDESNVICIDKSADFNTEEEFGGLVERFKNNHIKSGYKILKEESFNGENGMKAIKVLEKGPNGNLYVIYWFKINSETIGRILSFVELDNSDIEKDIIGIVNSWEYL